MDRASTRDRLRPHCGAVCEAVLASDACVNERSQTATKIFSEDRPAARRLSIVKIASSALDQDRCIARAEECPDGNDASLTVAFLNLKTIPSGRSRTRASSPQCSTASVAIGTIWPRRGAGVERHAQFAVIPQHRTRRRTRVRARFSGKTELSRDHAARSPSSGQDGA
jgi:hypothetical protein